MKLASLLEGGITGATTLSLIQEALHKIDPKTPRPFLHNSGVIKKLKNKTGKKGSNKSKLYIQLAGELLGTASYFGLSALGKKKNAVLRGGLLGALAGLGVTYLGNNNDEDDDEIVIPGEQNGTPFSDREEVRKKILTIILYTAGGLLAGTAIKKIKKDSFKKMAKKVKKVKKNK